MTFEDRDKLTDTNSGKAGMLCKSFNKFYPAV